jgi:hypothetical protein
MKNAVRESDLTMGDIFQIAEYIEELKETELIQGLLNLNESVNEIKESINEIGEDIAKPFNNIYDSAQSASKIIEDLVELEVKDILFEIR